MNLLALDTSTEYLSLAISRGDKVFTFDTHAGQTHSQIILPQIQALLDSANLTLKDLDGIAFGAGPGSFTGVRIAAGVVQGLAFGAGLPVVGVCTLLALAQASQASKVIACLDARMGEVYHAVYVMSDGKWQTIMEPGLYKPSVVPPLVDLEAVNLVLVNNDWVGVGSGWKTYPTELGDEYQAQLQSILPDLTPTAKAIFELAKPIFEHGEAKPASEAMPIYVRNRVALKTVEREHGLRL